MTLPPEGTRPRLSVVRATTDAWPDLATCLSVLEPQIRALDAELIIGDGDGQGLPEQYSADPDRLVLRGRPIGDGDFACADGPFDGYCTLEPYRGCKTDADCPRATDTCAFRIRPCLGASTATGITEPLTLVGRAGLAEGELVAAHCLGAGTNAIGNAGLGLPAAAAWRLPYVLETSPTCRAP